MGVWLVESGRRGAIDQHLPSLRRVVRRLRIARETPMESGNSAKLTSLDGCAKLKFRERTQRNP